MNPKKIAAAVSVIVSTITGSTVGLLYANEEDSLEIIESADAVYADFERTSVDTIISELVKEDQSTGDDDGSGDTNPEPPLPGVPPPNPPSPPDPGTYTPTGDWYDYSTGKSLTYSTTPYKTINIGTGDGTEEIGLYSGLPWDPSGVSYIYNNRQAAEDVINYIETVSGLDSGLSVKSAFVYEFSSKKSNIKEVDGIPTIGVALPPSVFYDAFCNNFTQEMWKSVSCPDPSYYERKACVIVQDTSGNVFYMPTHKGDAKAHTFPGGAIQTHLKVTGHDSAANTYTLDIGDGGERDKKMTITDVVKYLDTIVAPGSKNENSPLRDFWKVNVEVKYITREALKELNTYKVMGIVVW